MLTQELENQYDRPMGTNISYLGNLTSKTPNENSNKSTFENFFKKVSESSAFKGTSLIANSTLTPPTINLFPISINVFAAKTDNLHFKKEESIILNLEHVEFEKGYAPVAYFHNESDKHQISEKGRTGHLSIYGCIHNIVLSILKQVIFSIFHIFLC